MFRTAFYGVLYLSHQLYGRIDVRKLLLWRQVAHVRRRISNSLAMDPFAVISVAATLYQGLRLVIPMMRVMPMPIVKS